ncbi:hypothetical protein EVAR_47245_1 [Eumeta japonica]|uniref:Uncharacterized protein n=1 Tax=Eumeta variegata TaxID=151549 RepID=A0A4C1XGY5_EUMVA|nr:hypothetical protein EVAR_47245_1 [Eumeta japonica]
MISASARLKIYKPGVGRARWAGRGGEAPAHRRKSFPLPLKNKPSACLCSFHAFILNRCTLMSERLASAAGPPGGCGPAGRARKRHSPTGLLNNLLSLNGRSRRFKAVRKLFCLHDGVRMYVCVCVCARALRVCVCTIIEPRSGRPATYKVDVILEHVEQDWQILRISSDVAKELEIGPQNSFEPFEKDGLTIKLDTWVSYETEYICYNYTVKKMSADSRPPRRGTPFDQMTAIRTPSL